jgi:hypothetical protein
MHPAQRTLPIADLAGADAIYAYSFILTTPGWLSGSEGAAGARPHRSGRGQLS